MKFVVAFKNGKQSSIRGFPYVVLKQDNWDDYGYKTTFNATLHVNAGEQIPLGNLKILKKGQAGGFTPMPEKPFGALGSEYCSVGGALDYYEDLFELGETLYSPYLIALGDVAYNDEIKASFEDDEGYRVSLLRFMGAERTIAEAAKLFTKSIPKQKRKGGGFVVKFKTKVAPESNSLTVDFDFRRKGMLPNRINVLIGYNGTGKTRLLSNLAIVASGYGYASKEDLLEEAAGRFIGVPPPFKTVVVVSYSAFDTFVIPGHTEIERARLRKDGAIFGYTYCGLRKRADSVESKRRGSVGYRLRTPEEIEKEFLSALMRIRDAGRQDALHKILRPLLQDASFRRIGITHLLSGSSVKESASFFRELSSGHKVVLKIVAELTAQIDGTAPTLVLIDEPETHLHPPLLAAFLKSIRSCLDQFDGYAVIATHSPVVLQETPARYIRVLKRHSDTSAIVPVAIETFGEEIGAITQDVFNLDDGSTDWHDTLHALARRRSLSEIEQMFERKLGFTARSYIASIGDECEE
ncbi:MAG: hypothetical protein E6Q98_19745 [Rhodospirillaceae bacterium]|nr:MAG: hypothetical protein E6Q98_19745 [Rhodospirillaceae bacterium]